MTLDEAVQRQITWKTNNGNTHCQHNRVVDFLISNKGQNTGYLACMVCGEAFLDPRKHYLPSDVKTLDELATQYR